MSVEKKVSEFILMNSPLSQKQNAKQAQNHKAKDDKIPPGKKAEHPLRKCNKSKAKGKKRTHECSPGQWGYPVGYNVGLCHRDEGSES